MSRVSGHTLFAMILDMTRSWWDMSPCAMSRVLGNDLFAITLDVTRLWRDSDSMCHESSLGTCLICYESRCEYWTRLVSMGTWLGVPWVESGDMTYLPLISTRKHIGLKYLKANVRELSTDWLCAFAHRDAHCANDFMSVILGVCCSDLRGTMQQSIAAIWGMIMLRVLPSTHDLSSMSWSYWFKGYVAMI